MNARLIFISCMVLTLTSSADAETIAERKARGAQVRAPLPQHPIQARKAREAKAQAEFDAVEEELLEKHTPPPPPALTQEEIEAIVDERVKNPKKPDPKPAAPEPDPFGKVGGLGAIGGIGPVGVAKPTE